MRRRPIRQRPAAVLLGLALAAACGREPSVPATQAGAPIPAAAQAASRMKIVFLGDSLTAGYGLSAAESYPSLLRQRWRSRGPDVEVVNAGVSGDTSAGGLRRVDWALDGDVSVLVVALGGNDALRGLSTEALHRNLAAIIERARKRNITVVLAGMEAPPNLGRAYASAFRQVYRDLAAEYRVELIPFLLEGIAGRPALNQADLIHPNAEGAARVAELVRPYVERAMREAGRDD